MLGEGSEASFESYAGVSFTDAEGVERTLAPLPLKRAVFWLKKLATAQNPADPAAAAKAQLEIMDDFPAEVGIEDAAISPVQLWSVVRDFLYHGAPGAPTPPASGLTEDPSPNPG